MLYHTAKPSCITEQHWYSLTLCPPLYTMSWSQKSDEDVCYLLYKSCGADLRACLGDPTSSQVWFELSSDCCSSSPLEASPTDSSWEWQRGGRGGGDLRLENYQKKVDECQHTHTHMRRCTFLLAYVCQLGGKDAPLFLPPWWTLLLYVTWLQFPIKMLRLHLKCPTVILQIKSLLFVLVQVWCLWMIPSTAIQPIHTVETVSWI